MSDLVIKQSPFYNLKETQEAIRKIESDCSFADETGHFSDLVNFSTAKNEPYQRWVRYREGYSTSLVEDLLSRGNVNPSTHYVADPMVGSGSTIIAAKRAGYDAIGVDVNPYCQLIVDTKLLSPSIQDIDHVNRFLDNLPTLINSQVSVFPPLSDYFPQDNLPSILAIKELILAEQNPIVRQILLAGWFFILEPCSNRKKDGNGLATRPAPVHDVIPFYRTTVKDIISDYSLHPFHKGIASKVYTGSACSFSLFASDFEKETTKKLGAIIFSPPYANAFDYYESYKMELLFGGLYSPEDYQLHKKEQIRNYRISYGRELACEYPIVEMLCKEIYTALPEKEAITGKKDARTRLMPNMLRGYFTDMGKVLEQLYSALDTNGHCYIVVDQSAYVGVIVPTDLLLADIAKQKGFHLEKIIICRNAATSAQQRKAYPYLGTTLRESIVCLVK